MFCNSDCGWCIYLWKPPEHREEKHSVVCTSCWSEDSLWIWEKTHFYILPSLVSMKPQKQLEGISSNFASTSPVRLNTRDLSGTYEWATDKTFIDWFGLLEIKKTRRRKTIFETDIQNENLWCILSPVVQSTVYSSLSPQHLFNTFSGLVPADSAHSEFIRYKLWRVSIRVMWAGHRVRGSCIRTNVFKWVYFICDLTEKWRWLIISLSLERTVMCLLSSRHVCNNRNH